VAAPSYHIQPGEIQTGRWRALPITTAAVGATLVANLPATTFS